MNPETARVFAGSFDVYGARKVFWQIVRKSFSVALRAVKRLMAGLGLQRLIGGRPVRATERDSAAACRHASRRARIAGVRCRWRWPS